jgi:diguanylate cyclase (GGDEF)-like protein/PAS domain S-box-containing protein
MTGSHHSWRRWINSALLVLVAVLVPTVDAAPAPPAPHDSRDDATTPEAAHPLEREALVDPAGVQAKLPGALASARAAHDDIELARLYMAQANACRVLADWACQRDAGTHARVAAQRAAEPLLVVRGLIAEARGSNALQDFPRGERSLTEAQLVLRTHPSPVLAADVALAYSSLCNQIGKYRLSLQYADRGLEALRRADAAPMQVRLLRNKATAYSQLGDLDGAAAALAKARAMATRVDDPKLNAEVLLVTARIAHRSGDVRTQVESGRGVLAYGAQLHNAQLAAQGHEVLGLAAIDAGDGRLAERELGEAQKVYRQFASSRDEVRALRELIRLMQQRNADVEAAPFVRRFLEQERALDAIERVRVSEDLEARLKYAESEMARLRLEDEATLARERERSLARDKQLTSWLMALAMLVTLVLAAFFVEQRRANRALAQAFVRVRESESQAQELLRLSTGFVFLHDLSGRMLLVNPAAAAALGGTSNTLEGQSFVDHLAEAGTAWTEHAASVEAGGLAERVLRVRTVEGERHWRLTSRRMNPRDARPYVVSNAVDVTAQVAQADALREQSERDALTGCWNRRKLDAFEREHHAGSWAAIGIDLDHFKRINDTEGHERGDRVLVGIAGFLSAHAHPDDVLVRSGGDEFLLLLPGTRAGGVDALCEHLRADAAQAPCGFSLGAALREEGESLAETIARADAAMYAARGRVRGKDPRPEGQGTRG